MSFFQQKQPQLVSSPFSSTIFGNISLLDRISQQQEANKALLGEAKLMESDMRLQSMDETLSDQEQDDSQSDKVSMHHSRLRRPCSLRVCNSLFEGVDHLHCTCIACGCLCPSFLIAFCTPLPDETIFKSIA
jgi:hypothetical protein